MYRTLLIWVFVILLLALSVNRILGALAAPILEKKLSSLFGMPVQIDAMDVNPVTGQVYGEGVHFWNQAGFSHSPHLRVRSLQFDIDFLALKRKHVKIGTVILREPYYLIEKAAFEAGEERTNITTWVRHIRNRNGGDDEEDEGEPSWRVTIENIIIEKGTFVYDDRSRYDQENRFVFQSLNGSLRGFEWPSVSPEHLSQRLEVDGLLGQIHPAPFTVHGHANFATSQVSFDLEGRARRGLMTEYKRFWDNLPIVVEQGYFDLNIRMICMRKMVRSRSILRLYGLRVTAGPRVTEKLWGIPMATALSFLQNQKEIYLRVPVSGNISDPRFAFDQAFIQAFQKALGHKLQSGIKIFAEAPIRLAEQTGKVVIQTHEKISSGFEKITSVIVKKENE